jgi:hypothetical protein
MNDFEHKLSRLPFQPPPEALRESLFPTTATNVAILGTARWGWRDWLWPAPQAWAALAALWIIFAALLAGDHQATAPLPFVETLQPGTRRDLLFVRASTDLTDAFDLASR